MRILTAFCSHGGHITIAGCIHTKNIVHLRLCHFLVTRFPGQKMRNCKDHGAVEHDHVAAPAIFFFCQRDKISADICNVTDFICLV